MNDVNLLQSECLENEKSPLNASKNDDNSNKKDGIGSNFGSTEMIYQIYKNPKNPSHTDINNRSTGKPIEDIIIPCPSPSLTSSNDKINSSASNSDGKKDSERLTGGTCATTVASRRGVKGNKKLIRFRNCFNKVKNNVFFIIFKNFFFTFISILTIVNTLKEARENHERFRNAKWSLRYSDSTSTGCIRIFDNARRLKDIGLASIVYYNDDIVNQTVGICTQVNDSSRISEALTEGEYAATSYDLYDPMYDNTAGMCNLADFYDKKYIKYNGYFLDKKKGDSDGNFSFRYHEVNNSDDERNLDSSGRDLHGSYKYPVATGQYDDSYPNSSKTTTSALPPKPKSWVLPSYEEAFSLVHDKLKPPPYAAVLLYLIKAHSTELWNDNQRANVPCSVNFVKRYEDADNKTGDLPPLCGRQNTSGREINNNGSGNRLNDRRGELNSAGGGRKGEDGGEYYITGRRDGREEAGDGEEKGEDNKPYYLFFFRKTDTLHKRLFAYIALTILLVRLWVEFFGVLTRPIRCCRRILPLRRGYELAFTGTFGSFVIAAQFLCCLEIKSPPSPPLWMDIACTIAEFYVGVLLPIYQMIGCRTISITVLLLVLMLIKNIYFVSVDIFEFHDRYKENKCGAGPSESEDEEDENGKRDRKNINQFLDDNCHKGNDKCKNVKRSEKNNVIPENSYKKYIDNKYQALT